MKFRALSIASMLLIALAGGCSPYYEDFQFRPRPALAEIRSTAGGQAPTVVALSSVIGVHREDRDLNIPDSIEIRLRLENNGQESVSINPHSLELTGANLLPFPPPIVRAPNSIALNANQAATFTAFFPLPRRFDSFELDSLTLRWTVQIGSQNLGQSATFRRVYSYPYYDDPYWGPYVGYGPTFWYGGVVVVHHRR